MRLRLLTTVGAASGRPSPPPCLDCQTGGAKQSARCSRDCAHAIRAQSRWNARCGRSRSSFSSKTSGCGAEPGLGAAEQREKLLRAAGSDSQTLAALGAASVDDRTATAALHANEEAMRACAADFRSLVGAFHDALLCVLGFCWVTCRALHQNQRAAFLSGPFLRGRVVTLPKRCSSGNPLLHQKHRFPSMT